jgi:hypothetical protein
MPATPLVVSANVSNVKCDGEVIPGLQSIDYKIVRARKNVHAIGIHERLGTDYGEMYVTGALRVRSAYPKFDKLMAEEKPFQLVVELKKGTQSIGTISFDECALESNGFSMDANGQALSEYAFSGTRIRSKMGGTETDYGKIPGL